MGEEEVAVVVVVVIVVVGSSSMQSCPRRSRSCTGRAVIVAEAAIACSMTVW